MFFIFVFGSIRLTRTRASSAVRRPVDIRTVHGIPLQQRVKSGLSDSTQKRLLPVKAQHLSTSDAKLHSSCYCDWLFTSTEQDLYLLLETPNNESILECLQESSIISCESFNMDTIRYIFITAFENPINVPLLSVIVQNYPLQISELQFRYALNQFNTCQVAWIKKKSVLNLTILSSYRKFILLLLRYNKGIRVDIAGFVDKQDSLYAFLVYNDLMDGPKLAENEWLDLLCHLTTKDNEEPINTIIKQLSIHEHINSIVFGAFTNPMCSKKGLELFLDHSIHPHIDLTSTHILVGKSVTAVSTLCIILQKARIFDFKEKKKTPGHFQEKMLSNRLSTAISSYRYYQVSRVCKLY